MSEIDKRVVELEFDNSQFEKNTRQSMKTIDKLDKKLAFNGASEGLDKVSLKISSFQIAAIAAISNITNRIVNLGIQIVKSLSVDNISAGWDKFGQKSTSVATIFAQQLKIAGRVIEDDAEKLEVINEQLDKLNWFTDETSYNFTDMVDNIGKFTAAGVDLDKAVNAMMGIANWAALSGQNAITASRAMYQLAQALSKGYVQLQDYKSIQNANMDTQEFRQTVLDTAVAMGELTKVGEDYVTKTGKKFNKNQFTEALNEQWFTSNVLTASLEKYSAAVQRIYEISEETGLTASQVMARYSDELDEFGLKAFKAAQEARTFSDVLNSIKDAVSTGWMNTAEKLFGGYKESVVTWTELANALYDVFAEGGNFRNAILDVWSKLGGRNNIFGKHGDSNQGAFWNVYDSIVAVIDIIKSTLLNVFSLTSFESETEQIDDLGNKFFSLTERIKNYTSYLKESILNNETFSNVLNGVFTILKTGVYILKATLFALEPIFDLSKKIISGIFNKLSDASNNLEKFKFIFDAIEEISRSISEYLFKIFENFDIDNIFEKVINVFKDIFSLIHNIGPLELITNFIKDFFNAFKENSGTINSVKSILVSLFTIISKILSATIKITNILLTYLMPVVKKIFSVLAKAAGTASGILVKLTGIILEVLSGISNLAEAAEKAFSTVGSLKISDISLTINPVQSLCEGLKSLISATLVLLQSLLPVITVFIDILGKMLKFIGDMTMKLFGGQNKSGFLVAAVGVAVAVLVPLIVYMTSLATSVQRVTKRFEWILDGVYAVLRNASILLQAKIFSTIARSIFTMALAIAMLGRLDEKSLVNATAVIIILTAILISIFKMFEEDSEKKFSQLSKIQKKINIIQSIAMAMIKMSIAFSIFAKAVGNVSKLSGPELTAGISVIMLFLAGLMALSYGSSKLAKKDIQNLEGIAFASIMFGIAFKSIAKALTTLAKIPSGNSKGMLAAIGGLVILIGSLIGLSFAAAQLKSGDIAKLFVLSIVSNIFAIALIPLVSALAILSSLPWNSLLISIGAISLIIGSLIGLSFLASQLKGKDIAKLFVLSIVADIFSVSLFPLVASIKALSDISWDKLLISIGGIMLALSGILGLSFLAGKLSGKNIAKMLGLSIVANIFNISLIPLAKSLAILAEYDWVSMLVAVGSLLAVIASLVGMALLADKLDLNPMTMLNISFALTVLGGGLISLASGFKAMEDIQLLTIAKGLLTIVATLSVLAIVSEYIQPSVKSIVSLSVALTLIGIGLLTASLGLNLFVEGLVPLLEAIVANSVLVTEAVNTIGIAITETLIKSILMLLDAVKDMMPVIFEILTEIVNGLLQFIIDVSPKLHEAIFQVISDLLIYLNDKADIIFECIFEIIAKLLAALAKNIKSIANSLLDILLGIIDVLIDRIDDITKALIDFLIAATVALFDNIMPLIIVVTEKSFVFLIQVLNELLKYLLPLAGHLTKVALIVIAFSLKLLLASLGTLGSYLIAFIGGLLLLIIQIVKGMSNVIYETLKYIFVTVIELLGKVLRELAPMIKAAGTYLFACLAAGALEAFRESGLGKVLEFLGVPLDDAQKALDKFASDAKATMEKYGSSGNVKDAIKSAASEIQGTVGDIISTMSEITSDGMSNITQTVTDSMGELADAAAEFANETGLNLVGGLANGSNDANDEAYEAGAAAAETYLEGVTDTAEIHSPSRVMYEFGQYLIQGLVDGSDHESLEASNSISNIIKNIFDDITKVMDDEQDEFVITPVLDLTNVENGTRNISDLMSSVSGSSVSVSGNLASLSYNDRERRAKSSENQNGANSNVVTNEGDNYYSTFNVTTDNPEEFANEVDKILQNNRIKANMAKGG